MDEAKKDFLTEVLNVGLGRAGSALGEMTGARIDLSVPDIAKLIGCDKRNVLWRRARGWMPQGKLTKWKGARRWRFAASKIIAWLEAIDDTMSVTEVAEYMGIADLTLLTEHRKRVPGKMKDLNWNVCYSRPVVMKWLQEAEKRGRRRRE